MSNSSLTTLSSGNSYVDDIEEDDNVESNQDVQDPALLTILMRIREHERLLFERIPKRENGTTGRAFMKLFLENPDMCYEFLRMEPQVFESLCEFLRISGGLRSSRDVCVKEKVAIFLLIVGHSVRYRIIGRILNRSIETISQIFHEIADVFSSLSSTLIKRRYSCARVQPEIAYDPHFCIGFKECIGAMDGTHIAAFVRKEYIPTFRDSKGNISWNVIAICSHDMLFTHIISDWEGSFEDAYILEQTPNKREFMPYKDQYYAVDGDFLNIPGFLASYKDERFHCNDSSSRGMATTKEELFNQQHTALWKVIERSLGVMKKRFVILSVMPNFKLQTQLKIITACFCIHNFIRRESYSDTLNFEAIVDEMIQRFAGAEMDEIDPDEDNSQP